MKKLLLLCLCLAFGMESFAQGSYYYRKYDNNNSLNIGVGPSQYYGDLVNDRELNVNFHITGEYQIRTSNRFSIMPAISIYRISADDLNEKSKWDNRGLNFNATNIELSINGVIDLKPVYAGYEERPTFNPYFRFGLGFTTNNPKAEYGGTKYDLRELQTEGEDYSGVQFAIPIGVGTTFRITNNIDLAAEVSWRFLFNDYMDDVSSTYQAASAYSSADSFAAGDRRSGTIRGVANGERRGDADDDDSYAFGTIKLKFFLGRKEANSGVAQ